MLNSENSQLVNLIAHSFTHLFTHPPTRSREREREVPFELILKITSNPKSEFVPSMQKLQQSNGRKCHVVYRKVERGNEEGGRHHHLR